MLVVHADDAFQEHDTGRGHPECPDRARVIAASLRSHAAVARVEPATVDARAEDLALVHDAGYVAALGERVRQSTSLDADTAVCARSHDVALKAAGAVVRATLESIEASQVPQLTATGRVRRAAVATEALERMRSFCVVRPPGHHARPDRAMGFCLLNNAAVAAAVAVARGGLERVAVVDFDVHHGNGTQEMFWRDPRVLYVSLHRYPFYPGTGAAEETGEGKGKGTTANFPLRAGCGSERYREAFARAMDAVRAFKPGLILASAGFDAYARDPIGGLGLEPADYRWIGAELRAVADAESEGRLVSALEGGYAVEALPELVSEYVTGVDTGKAE